MKCPNCKHDSAKYIQRVEDRGWKRIHGTETFRINKRTDFTIKCRRCGYEGDKK